MWARADSVGAHRCTEEAGGSRDDRLGIKSGLWIHLLFFHYSLLFVLVFVVVEFFIASLAPRHHRPPPLPSGMCGGGLPHLWILGKQYVDRKKCQVVGNHTGATNVDNG
uniref:Uncharacterized protein n=1 Tax=Leersia perrieri TaxID=77586 RepID=A0A0D9VU18_9ORYZ